MRAPTKPGWRAWSGLVVPPLAWVAHHQFGSDLNFYDCRLGQGWLAAAVGVVAFAVSVVSGLLSWSARRHPPPANFVAIVGTMVAALLALTIVIQIGAALIVPACFR
jgi:hypothetical protein